MANLQLVYLKLYNKIQYFTKFFYLLKYRNKMERNSPPSRTKSHPTDSLSNRFILKLSNVSMALIFCVCFRFCLSLYLTGS